MAETKDGPITIKKYANRRLYNTATSSYVTLDHLCQMVKDGTDFVVYDAKSGDDITRSVLTQIIVEEENKGQNLLPIGFLRQLISFYGDSLGGLVPRYLEHSMQSFARNEEQMRSLLHNAFEGIFPLQNFEEMNKQNVALFENAMKMFTPFYGEAGAKGAGRPAEGAAVAGDGNEDPTIRELKNKLNDMQTQLNSLITKKS
ncbi:polyhydroxyalkanoate synthesis repressor PhaR [Insolitispirillum peregrinum]|uniref:Polyhydroxyalkanoate synthesis repressor PhaR n=1 Tax=Insolitispirillum peregrinum TaxID=80876 RepID=A0A1N7JZC4_9PROT|nr:polyhydroxyalkanoate synthesis repressor PhaR [Insolitispirillum peregrinum]SIS54685.1 polyhydroxyalkanoate synthesis repressor PhaR [Insolitispirillum peregrinum]